MCAPGYFFMRGFGSARERMVETQIEGRGITDPRVLAAMREVPRHHFVDDALVEEAYSDHALPLGYGATISQPYMVAKMSELLALRPGDRVLEIGAGSGYQTAVLVALGAEVYALEIIDALALSARARLQRLGYAKAVHLRCGDGSLGWPEYAPYAGILVAAAAPSVPSSLIAQLAPKARLVIPVGTDSQELCVLRLRCEGGLEERRLWPVRFVPLVGAGIDGD